MKKVTAEILKNEMLNTAMCRMVLAVGKDENGEACRLRPGQFVNIRIDGLFLRRPISVCDFTEDGRLTIVFKKVGKGTEKLAAMTPGEKLDLLAELGNGYDLSKAGPRPVLLGGGAGVPPMYCLARMLAGTGVCRAEDITVILGFNTASELYMEDDFRALGAKVIITTADGSRGTRGFVTDALAALTSESGGEPYTYTYACGPEPMLRAVYSKSAASGQYSFEERMGCGFGACMGCSCKTVTGCKRICKDGPVLEKEEILWD